MKIIREQNANRSLSAFKQEGKTRWQNRMLLLSLLVCFFFSLFSNANGQHKC